MADLTDNLKLILPENGEYTDIWDQPINSNFKTIDTAIGDINSEIVDARGAASSMAGRLDVALNDDGTLKDIPEVKKARNSRVYGNIDEFGNETDLGGRIAKGDFDAYYAWQGHENLRDVMARFGDDWVHDSVVSAPNNYLTFTGAQVKADGSTTNIIANINGYLARIRKVESVTVTGAAGDRWFALQRNPNGVVIANGTTATTNQYPATTGPIIKLKDTSKNFVSIGVKRGDLLKVLTPTAVRGYFVIADTNATNSNCAVDEVFVHGEFAAISSSVSYEIVDPVAATLAVETAPHSPIYQSVPNKIYIGKGYFDGTNMTSLTQYRLKGKYQEWQSVTLLSGNFNNVYAHQIGYVPRKVEIYASNTNDFLSPIYPLGVASGASGLERNIIVEISQDQIKCKNPINGLFYKDYAGVSQTTGFLLVIAER